MKGIPARKLAANVARLVGIDADGTVRAQLLVARFHWPCWNPGQRLLGCVKQSKIYLEMPFGLIRKTESPNLVDAIKAIGKHTVVAAGLWHARIGIAEHSRTQARLAR